MNRCACTLLLLGVCGCGSAATTYEVDLVTGERCTTRSGVESCEEAPEVHRRTATLIIETRADAVLLFLDQTLFVASSPVDPIEATRRDEQSDLETGCVHRTEQHLQLERLFDQVDGSLSWTERNEGPDGRCGQTPFGESGRDSLSGVQMEDP